MTDIVATVRGGWILPWLIIGGVALAGAAVVADQLTGGWANSAELDAQGRDSRSSSDSPIPGPGLFREQLAVRSRLYTEPGTRTWLEVRFKGDQWSQSVDSRRPRADGEWNSFSFPLASGRRQGRALFDPFRS